MRKIEDFFLTRPPEALYHYTGIGSLLGICQSHAIWASHAYYLNDSKEVLHACDVLSSAIEPRRAFGSLNAQEQEFARQFVAWMDSFRENQYCLFVFSLSEEASLLSQWRSYTPHGRGVSLGFAREMLQRLMANNDVRLARCVYDSREQEEILASLFDKLLTTFRREKPEPDLNAQVLECSYYTFLERFREEVLQVLALIKHEAFAEEREWRLISKYFECYTAPAVKFREGASLLVPYIELKLGNERPLFDQVVLGPTPHANLSMSALSMYLSNQGLSKVTANSNIPYREW